MVLNDTSMATIFKLLRIQYALSHQDEKDKQDIFLMGGKLMTNAPAAGNAAPQQTISEIATTLGENSADMATGLE